MSIPMCTVIRTPTGIQSITMNTPTYTPMNISMNIPMSIFIPGMHTFMIMSTPASTDSIAMNIRLMRRRYTSIPTNSLNYQTFPPGEPSGSPFFSPEEGVGIRLGEELEGRAGRTVGP
jgi:hypothetical protein